MFQNVSFYMYFLYLQQTWFHPKCHLRPSCIHMTNWNVFCIYFINHTFLLHPDLKKKTNKQTKNKTHTPPPHTHTHKHPPENILLYITRAQSRNFSCPNPPPQKNLNSRPLYDHYQWQSGSLIFAILPLYGLLLVYDFSWKLRNFPITSTSTRLAKPFL